MSQEDGALSTDVKEEPTEKIRSKYVHPSPEKNEITPLNKEESNKDNNKSYQNLSKKSSGWWEDLLSYELGEHIQEYTKVTYPDVLTDDGEPISVEIENHSFSKPPHAHKYAIHPNVPWKGQWDFIIIILVMINATLIPFSIAFPDEKFDNPATTIIMDLLFIIDLVFNFNTAFNRENGELEWDLKAIRNNYIRGWFVIDLVACMPLDLLLSPESFFSGGTAVEESEGSDASRVKLMLRILKLPRLLRMGRIFKYLDRFKYASTWRVIRLLFVFVMIGHWFGCGFILLAQSQEDSLHFFSEYGSNAPYEEIYTLALRTALLLMIGEGVDMTTNMEEWFAIIMLVLGNVLSAVIIGNISLVLANRNQQASKYQQKIDSIGVTMRTMRIPQQLQNRAMEYYDFLWQRHRRFDVHSDFTSDLSTDIRSRIQLELNEDTISNNPIFKTCSRAAVVAVLDRLHTQIYLGGDIIIREGDVGMEMYFLVKGKAAVVIKSGAQVAVYEDGAYFGELALIKEAPRSAHVFAKCHCDVKILSADDFEYICDYYPEIREKFVIHLQNKYAKSAEPEKVNLFIQKASNVKRADGIFGLSDPFVEVYFNDECIGRSQVIKKTLDPVWDEVVDVWIPQKVEGEDFNLTFTILDYNFAGKSDFLGKVSFHSREEFETVYNRDEVLTLPLQARDDENDKKISGTFSFNAQRLSGADDEIDADADYETLETSDSVGKIDFNQAFRKLNATKQGVNIFSQKSNKNKDTKSTSPKPVKKKDDVMQALSAFSRGKRTRKGTKVSMQGYVHEETEIVTNRMDVMDQHLMNIASLLDNLRNDGNNGKIQLPPIEQKADNIGADMKVPSSDVQNVNTIEEKKKEQEEVDSVN